MLFSSQSSDSLNALSTGSLNALPLQATTVLPLSTVSSGLVDPLQQTNLIARSSASTDAATAAGIIIVSGTPETAIALSSTPIYDVLASSFISGVTTLDNSILNPLLFPSSNSGNFDLQIENPFVSASDLILSPEITGLSSLSGNLVSLNPQPLPPSEGLTGLSSLSDLVSLNPQPLPPSEGLTGLSSLGDLVSLNPQPLPPNEGLDDWVFVSSTPVALTDLTSTNLTANVEIAPTSLELIAPLQSNLSLIGDAAAFAAIPSTATTTSQPWAVQTLTPNLQLTNLVNVDQVYDPGMNPYVDQVYDPGMNPYVDQVYDPGMNPWRFLLGDDTPDTARDIGHLSDSTVYTFNDHIGNSDKIDFYTFTLDDSNTVSFALTGLNAFADLTIYPVVGYAGGYTSYGQNDQLLQAKLDAGTYYVSVKTDEIKDEIKSPFGTTTDYTFRLRTNTTYYDPALLASKHNLGTLRGSHNFSGSSHNPTAIISAVEQYHFNLASASDLSMSINQGYWGLVQDANNNGLVDPGELIARGLGAEPLSLANLSPGSYFLQIGGDPTTNNIYNLNVTATPALNSATSALMGSEPNDSPNQAIEIGALIGQRSFSNTVGAADKNDFYRFNLPNMSNLNLSLSGLTANADVQVIRDVNHNGVVDPGDVVASSTLKGTASESLNLQGLDLGFYFVRVYGAEGNTNYTLNLTGTPGLGLAPEPNNTLETAYNIGTLNTLRQFDGFVGWSDADDYYRFTLGTSRQVDLTLGGMSALADLQLLDSNGVVLASDGTYSGHDRADISRSLAAGDYMVRVQHYEDPDYFPVNQDTRYKLSLAA